MNSSKTWLLIVLVLAANRPSVSSNQSQHAFAFEVNEERECNRRLNGLLFDKTEAAMKALDAFGKPEAGLLVENWAWFGHFSECSHLEDFKYCLLTINVMDSATAITRNNQTYLITWGSCVPQQCAYKDLINGIPALLDIAAYKLPGFDVNNIDEAIWCLEDPIIPYGIGFYLTVIFFIIIGTLMIAGSILDVLERNFKTDDQEGDQSLEFAPLLGDQNDANMHTEHSCYCFHWMVKTIASTTKLILLDFALNRNLKKLLLVREGDLNNIKCLHGIRVISLIWIILGHAFSFNPTFMKIFNPFDLADWKNNFFFQTLLLNFFYAVDSFFFLSGLLVCFTTLRKLEATDGRFHWLWFYVHRYIRLSPLMLIVIMINTFIAPYFIGGPYAQIVLAENDCANYWWTNLLYINNIYPWKLQRKCLGWTWYLANDMQFFIISPIIILSLKRINWLGFGVIGTMMTVSCVITGTLVAAFNFRSPTWELMRNGSEYMYIIYTKPYARIPPYLVGMFLGYVLFKLKGRKITIPRHFVFSGWLIASAVAAALLCGTNTFNPSKYHSNHGTNATTLRHPGFVADHHATALGSVAYEMFSRLAWGIFLSWVVVTCQFGRPGWVNDILSWSFWEPLSRMNYNAYLVHPMLLFIFYGNFGVPFYASRTVMTFYFCGTVLLSYISAMVLTLALEMPIANLERRFMPPVV